MADAKLLQNSHHEKIIVKKGKSQKFLVLLNQEINIS